MRVLKGLRVVCFAGLMSSIHKKPRTTTPEVTAVAWEYLLTARLLTPYLDSPSVYRMALTCKRFVEFLEQIHSLKFKCYSDARRFLLAEVHRFPMVKSLCVQNLFSREYAQTVLQAYPYVHQLGVRIDRQADVVLLETIRFDELDVRMEDLWSYGLYGNWKAVFQTNRVRSLRLRLGHDVDRESTEFWEFIETLRVFDTLEVFEVSALSIRDTAPLWTALSAHPRLHTVRLNTLTLLQRDLCELTQSLVGGNRLLPAVRQVFVKYVPPGYCCRRGCTRFLKDEYNIRVMRM